MLALPTPPPRPCHPFCRVVLLPLWLLLSEQAIPEAQPLTIPRGFRWWVPDYVPPDTLIVRKTVFVLVSGTVDGRMSLWDWDPVNLVVRVQCHDD